MIEKIKVVAFDADDTLWENQEYFDEAETRFCETVSEYGDEESVRKELFKTEMKNMGTLGYGVMAFTMSMIETALHLSGDTIPAAGIHEIYNIGRALLMNPATPFPGVEETLDTIAATRPYKLIVITNIPDPPPCAMADGRLLWRVLDNLFNNVCKYALAGTRVYIDAAVEGEEAVISVKNISRDPLNLSAEELMERFVRGDASRHTEGSGLGLNIAQSLVALMHGRFAISIDGDLFKAEIRLPAQLSDAKTASARAVKLPGRKYQL